MEVCESGPLGMVMSTAAGKYPVGLEAGQDGAEGSCTWRRGKGTMPGARVPALLTPASKAHYWASYLKPNRGLSGK